MKTILNNWSVVGTENPYLAPECRTVHLAGNVINHPRLGDAKSIITSAI